MSSLHSSTFDNTASLALTGPSSFKTTVDRWFVRMDTKLDRATKSMNPHVTPQALTIVVSEVPGRPSQFMATLNGSELVTSKTPFLDSARALLASGYDPATILLMKWVGKDVVSLSGRLGELSKLDIRDDNSRGPEFIPYKPGLRP